MSTPVIRSILSRVNADRKHLNILTCPTHERYESNLAKTGHNFYTLEEYTQKSWKDQYAKRPDNYNIITYDNVSDISFDLVLIQQKFGQYQFLQPIAQNLHLPTIVLEHTLPMPHWNTQQRQTLKNMKGDVNVFISEYSKGEWGWEGENCHVLEHGIDTEVFKSEKEITRRYNRGLSVVNDWINRDKICGYSIWKEATKGLPVEVYGDTPGLSKPTKDTQELIKAFNNNKIFINTSVISPVPTSLMEAMACECAVISLNNCMIPEIIKDSHNGILCDTMEDVRSAFTFLLQNPKVCEILGKNARQTIEKRYNLDRFLNKWNKVFNHTKELKFGTRS